MLISLASVLCEVFPSEGNVSAEAGAVLRVDVYLTHKPVLALRFLRLSKDLSAETDYGNVSPLALTSAHPLVFLGSDLP